MEKQSESKTKIKSNNESERNSMECVSAVRIIVSEYTIDSDEAGFIFCV